MKGASTVYWKGFSKEWVDLINFLNETIRVWSWQSPIITLWLLYEKRSQLHKTMQQKGSQWKEVVMCIMAVCTVRGSASRGSKWDTLKWASTVVDTKYTLEETAPYSRAYLLCKTSSCLCILSISPNSKSICTQNTLTWVAVPSYSTTICQCDHSVTWTPLCIAAPASLILSLCLLLCMFWKEVI